MSCSLMQMKQFIRIFRGFFPAGLGKRSLFYSFRQVGAAEAKSNGLAQQSSELELEGVFHETVDCPEAESMGGSERCC